MTTIILTIIGILLAAAAALMVIFYGGDAFNSGSIGAQANTLQNAGTNVISAVQMYKAENAKTPAGLTDLTTDGPNGAYLDETPALPGSVSSAYANGVLTLSGVTNEVCLRVNKNLKLTAAPADVDGVKKMGCVPAADTEDAGVVTGNSTFYAKA